MIIFFINNIFTQNIVKNFTENKNFYSIRGFNLLEIHQALDSTVLSPKYSCYVFIEILF